MKCKDIMKRNVVTCRSTDKAQDCAKIMRDMNVGFVPIVDEQGTVLGTVTDRDLVVRLLAKGKANGTALAKLMSKDLIACSPDDDLGTAAKQMERKRKSRILVLDGRKCVGVISLSDIAQRETTKRTGEVLREITTRESRTRATA